MHARQIIHFCIQRTISSTLRPSGRTFIFSNWTTHLHAPFCPQDFLPHYAWYGQIVVCIFFFVDCCLRSLTAWVGGLHAPAFFFLPERLLLVVAARLRQRLSSSRTCSNPISAFSCLLLRQFLLKAITFDCFVSFEKSFQHDILDSSLL